MEKRLLVALALSLVVLFVFQGFLKGMPSRRLAHRVTPAPVKGESPSPTTAAPLVAASSGTAKTTQMPVEKEETVETEKFTLVFSDIGGTLKKIVLKEYGSQEKEEVLCEEASPASRLFAMDIGPIPDLAKRKFTTTRGADHIQYRYVEPGLMEVTKKISFHKDFDYIDLEISIKNLSSGETTFAYEIIGAGGIKDLSAAGRKLLQSESMIDGKIWRVKAVKAEKEKSGTLAWTGSRNQYFATVLKPEKPMAGVSVTTTNAQDLGTIVKSYEYRLSGGLQQVDRYKFYAGPLNEKRISVLGNDAQAIVDYGFFGAVSKALLVVLRKFYGWTGNWGLAIILLTVAINIVIFPLTLKSFVSMQQMKKVQPHVEKLKELHKDNPQKLNREMMELYKKYNVNPLGGCLPLLLQMPIFIALYQALMNTIDLKGGKFLWIADLSRPDAVPLPASLPLIGKSINILPILMAIGMFAQQMLSQKAATGTVSGDQASQQKMMMIMFPLLFGFMFYNMPSGLVLYWLTNTVLMTAEQGLISRRVN